jgi:flagellar assembly protein FliH
MSTSSSTAQAKAWAVREFAYPEMAAGVVHQMQGGSAVGESDARSREIEARETGRRDAEAKLAGTFEEKISAERKAISVALTDFQQERQRYYEAVEAEVVQLALAIARKILHREAQTDPLLLAGIVRVALEKLKINTEVVLRTHPQHASHWREYFSEALESSLQPKIVEDAAISPESCVLQTQLGITELGVEPQLKEIEAGLMDIIAKKPS